MWEKSGFMFDRGIDGPWYGDHTGWSWIMGLHGGFWLLIVVLIVAMLVLALRLSTRTEPSSRMRRKSALDNLEARYPRGEIGGAEYRERREHLT